MSGNGPFRMANQYEGVSTAPVGVKHFWVKVTTQRLIWDPRTQIPAPGLSSSHGGGQRGSSVNTQQPWDSPAWWGEGDGVNTRQPWDSPRPSSKSAQILHGSPNS